MKSPDGFYLQERRQSFESLSSLSQKGNACCRVRGCVKTISVSLWGVELHVACSGTSDFFFVFFSSTCSVAFKCHCLLPEVGILETEKVQEMDFKLSKYFLEENKSIYDYIRHPETYLWKLLVYV